MASLIKGKTGEWEMVIGLEVHAQVISRAKLFSGAATAFGAEPNTQVSLVDAAMPGMLPVVNGFVIEQAVKSGLGLKARINLHSVFERKNYFYPDLPPGYQISQYLEPIVGNGTLLLDLPDGATREVGIERLHLEMDAGKSLHDQHPSQTYVDLNRSGVALMEIVSKPDLRSPEEAGAYLRKLRSILRYLGTCDGNMEQGSLRCDVNVSVRRPGADLGTRTETKNLNSIRFVEQAIEVEARRQVALLEEGGEVVQETRLFDSAKGRTRPMRTSLPELPDAKKERFMADFGLPAYDAGVLVGERETAEFYEAVVAGKRDPKAAANWVTGAYFGALNRTGETLDTAPVDAAALGGLLDLIADKTISGRIAKDVFDEMWKTGKSAAEIVEEKGLRQITDTGAIEGILDEIIAGAPAQVEQFKSGNEKVLGWFVGQAMKATQGKANPGLVNQLLRQKLGK
jgi:aspartyl-tRNA(Asn)/glutamyl-tRNA(Gln) amidotransferase subunit B